MENTEEIKEKLRQIIELHKTTYLAYKNFLEIIVKPNEEKIKLWQKEVVPTQNNFDVMLENSYKNLTVIDDIISQYGRIFNSVMDSDTISNSYLTLVYNTLNESHTMRELPRFLRPIQNLYDDAINNEIDFQKKHTFIAFAQSIFQSSVDIATKDYLSLAQIYAFKYFGNTDENFVIIGANGSGKSSFARNTKKVLGKNVAIIAAQKIFSLKKVSSVSLGKTSRERVWNYQSNDKLYKDTGFTSDIGSDLQRLFESLVEEQNACANEYFEANKYEENAKRKTTTLEHTIAVWHEVLLHRGLKYNAGELKVFAQNINEYDFMGLSDGEKAVFYYIAHVLLAKENSFIIIDEPENHLHLALVTKLWDRLEQERKDCHFIYLTHNLDFAASRVNAEKLWMKDFMPPAQWSIEQLPQDDDLPEILYMELLGSRKPILFCEGTKSSLDYKLYTRLFPEYTVIPSKGHIQVISYTRAFNKSIGIHGNKAIGIIDGDFHTAEQKEAWKKDFIYCVDAQEVENILCDEDLLKSCYKRFYATDEKLDEAKNILFKKLSQNIDAQTVEYATQTINEYLKENLLEKAESQEALKNSFQKLLNDASNMVDKLIQKRKTELEDIIAHKDYELGVRKYNYKGLVGIVPVVIEKDYKDKIFVFLDENSEVLTTLRNKYFHEVPTENKGIAK